MRRTLALRQKDRQKGRQTERQRNIKHQKQKQESLQAFHPCFVGHRCLSPPEISCHFTCFVGLYAWVCLYTFVCSLFSLKSQKKCECRSSSRVNSDGREEQLTESLVEVGNAMIRSCRSIGSFAKAWVAQWSSALMQHPSWNSWTRMGCVPVFPASLSRGAFNIEWLCRFCHIFFQLPKWQNYFQCPRLSLVFELQNLIEDGKR